MSTHDHEPNREGHRPQVPATVRTFIESHGHFLVVGHKEPDGDSVASQIVCGDLLSALGKVVSLCSVGPFGRPEIAAYAERFSSTVPDEVLRSPARV